MKHTVRYHGCITVVLENPTIETILRMASQPEKTQIRGTAYNGAAYVWRAAEMIHGGIREHFGIREAYRPNAGVDFWIIPDGDDPDSSDWTCNDGNPVRDGLRLLIGSAEDPALSFIERWFRES